MVARLHAVLVTFCRGPQLFDYFEALRRQTRPLDTLVVVDNDVGRSAEWIMTAHGLATTDVSYMVADDNVGPAGGIALGMARILEYASDDDWVFTLDDDDPPRTPELLGELQRFGEVLRADGLPVGGVGLVGGRFDEDLGRFVTVADEELVGAVESSWIGGNQLPCYSVGAIRDVGLFDPCWFINFEELDFGLRMRDRGHLLYAHGELWLRERTEAGRLGREAVPSRELGEPHWRRYYSNRNLIFLLRRRGLRRQAAKAAAIHLAKPVAHLLRSPGLAWQHLVLNARAVLDAYRGRMGRTVEPTPKPYAPRD